MNKILIDDLLENTHAQWHEYLRDALSQVEPSYLVELTNTHNWLPGQKTLLAAFQAPMISTQYVLLGESPYPRTESANGYAFWDAAVDSLWSETGFSKPVNRATSLRNLLKMLLHARGDLTRDFSQAAISNLDKSIYCKTGAALFSSFIQNGFLLLNASLVYRSKEVVRHARHWQPFLKRLFHRLAEEHPNIQWVVLGRIAKNTMDIISEGRSYTPALLTEHPYNVSFITNPDVLQFFKPMDLLYDKP